MRISDWSSDVCSSDLQFEVTRLGIDQHVCNAPMPVRSRHLLQLLDKLLQLQTLGLRNGQFGWCRTQDHALHLVRSAVCGMFDYLFGRIGTLAIETTTCVGYDFDLDRKSVV